MPGVASDGPLGAPCSWIRTAVITAACTKITIAAAVADHASVRGLRLDRNAERRLPRSKMPLAQRIVSSGKLIGKLRTDDRT
jgi:hypothetical protein